MSLFKQAIKYSSIVLLAAALTSCGSKKTATDENAAGDAGAAAPKIESTPMSFDPQGSDSGKIDGLQTVHFDFDKANLKAADKKKIEGNADWMKSHNNIAVQIEGHCDAKGSIEYNLALGERRAKAVKEYMVHLGVPADKLSIISYGKEKPVASGDSEADYAKNRRANFVPLAQ
jgi:peptidoglycan-associated lipoprotein